MPKKKPSEKNKAWEKDRRDRLNKSFDQLAKLLPQYDPSITWSKIEIIQKSIEHIESLHKQHEDFLKSKDPEILKDYNKAIESIKYFKTRNEQLSELLVKAKISLPPSSKIPIISLDYDKLIENNNLNNNINIKPVGRPGKYINKIGTNHDNKIENNETNVNSIEPSSNNSNKIEATIATEQKSNESTNKEKEIPANPVCSAAEAPVTITSTNSAISTIEKGDIVSTGILLPVISIQTQPPPPGPTLKQSVITSQIISNPSIPLPLPSAAAAPPPVPTSTISNQITHLLPPLINVTNLSSISKIIKNTTTGTGTITTPGQIFNYAKDKNGKIKILPKPQIKLYFRRADGKIPIPVLKRRYPGPIKRKRKRKCSSKINTTLKCKKRKINLNNEIKINEKFLKDKKPNDERKHLDILQPLFIKTENHNRDDDDDNDKGKNKENVISNTIPGTELPNDFQFSELEIPQHETNPNSVSPTAAFLMSFPVVNTSNGKYSGIVDDNEILTPNLERKDPNGVDNLENLNNFFTTKEYTKYCRENPEKNSCEKKSDRKSVTILEDIKFPSSSFNSNVLFNPYSNIVTNSNNNSFNSITYQACGTQSAPKTTTTSATSTIKTILTPAIAATTATVTQGSIFTSTNSQSHFIPIPMPNITSSLLDPLHSICTSDTLTKMNTCLPYSNNQQFSLFSSYSAGSSIPMPVITTQNSPYKKDIKTSSITSSNAIGISAINVASTQQSSVSIANKQNNSNTIVSNAAAAAAATAAAAAAVITRSSSSTVDTSFLPNFTATTSIFYNNSTIAPPTSFSVASMSLDSTISRTATISESTVSKASISSSESKISKASISTTSMLSSTVPVPNFNAGSFPISSTISQVDYLPPFHNSSYTMNKLPKSNDSTYVAESNSIKTTAPTIWTPSFVSSSSNLNSDFSTPALVYTTATITVGSGNFSRYSSPNLSQNPFNTSNIGTYNSYTTSLTPRCTPLPLDNNLNNNIQSSLESCAVEDIVPPPPPGKLKSQVKYAANKNIIPTSISSVQRNVNIGLSIGIDSKSNGISNKLITPSKSSSSIGSFVQNSNPSKTASNNTNNAEIKDTTSSTASIVYTSLPVFTSSFNTIQSTIPTSSYSRTNEFNITNSICYSHSSEMSNLIPSSIPSQSSGTCSNISSSTRGGQIFNHSNSYRDYSTSQNLLNSSSHIYPSTTNYYYPQTHSTFGLSLTTPSNVAPTQMDTSQNVLPYSSIKPDMSWMPSISNDYKTPSFSFSLTPTTSTVSYKESNSTITSIVSKSSNLPPQPPNPVVTKDNKNSTKSLFNMFTTTTPAPVRYRPPQGGNLNTKESVNFFPSTTATISASLTNTKPVNATTVNEIKMSSASTPVKQSQSITSQQCNNINNNNHFQPVSSLASSNNHFFPCNSQQQLETNKKDSVYPMKSIKTEVSPQKPRNSFTIDATLGIAAAGATASSNTNSNNCYLENMKKPSGSYNGNSRDDSKTHSNRNKAIINNERNSNNNVSVQNDNNNFYECSEKTEKFNQKLHINNWMMPSNKEIHMNTMDYGQSSSSYRMPTDPYHSTYGVCEDNFSSWSPNKIYDIHFNTPPTCHIPGNASGPADIIVKEEKNYTKSSLGGSSANQTNFFSVSQLVDQGSTTNNAKECEGYQRKILPPIPLNKVKNQGLLKEENKSSSYLMNPSETMPSENLNCIVPIKAPFSNSYSAEALISKKEKHRNFSGMPSSEYYNPMDTGTGAAAAASGILYNQLDINNEQNYNSNYFYNYPSSQNYPQDVDYLGGYATDNHFGKILNKHHKKIPPTISATNVAAPPAPAPPAPPPSSNLISYESNYFPPVPFNPHPSIDGYHESHHHYNHSGNYQTNTTWGGTTGKTSSLISGYQQNQQNQHYQSVAAGSVGDISHHMNPESGHHPHSSQQPTVTGNLTNFNLSTICPEINDKVAAAPSAW